MSIDRRYSVAEGQAIKAPCNTATTANITLSGAQTVGGVALTETSPPMRCLVKDQSTASQNGIYDVSTGPWTRSRDFDGAYDIVTGTQVYVTSSQLIYAVSTANPITIDTTSIAFVLIGGSTAPVSAAMKPVIAAATLPLARTAFGLNGYGTRDDGTILYPNSTITAVAINRAIAAADHLTRFIATGPVNFTLPLASTLWNGFGFWLEAVTGDVTLVPDATNAIAGSISAGQSVTIPAGAKVFITTNAAASGPWYVEGMPWLVQNPRSCSGTYNVSISDNGKILKHNSGAFGTFIFPAAATLPADFRCLIINGETTAIGKGVGGTDIGSFTLYPGQSYLVINDNGTVRLVGGKQLYKVDSIALFTNASSGSDNPLVSDGLSTTTRARLTLSATKNALYRDFNHNGSQPSVTNTGTFDESITFAGMPVNTGAFFWMGSSDGGFTTRPASAGTPYCYILGDGAIVIIKNLWTDGNGITSTAFQLHQTSILDVGISGEASSGCAFGSHGNPSGAHFATDGAGWTLNINGNYKMNGVGGAAVHINAIGAGVVNYAGSITVTITNTPNIGTFFRGQGPNLISLGASVTWTGAIVVGGQKWSIGPASYISLGGNAANVPGSVAGAPATGAAPAAATGWAVA